MNHKNDLTRLNELSSAQQFDPGNKQNKDFIMSQLLHFSDISNSTKPFDIYQKWVDKLFIEFWEQGDRERELNLPISMLCDREKTDIPSSQVFFINAITMDLAKALCNVYPYFNKLITQLEENRNKWEEKKGQPYIIAEAEKEDLVDKN